MADTYAKIDMTYNPGIVVNTQLVESTDVLDSSFTWVDITNISPQPHTGWAYNGTSFTNVIVTPYLGAIPSGIPVGSATTFTAFTLSPASSSFSVSVSGRLLTVGCQKFDYIWARYAIYMLTTQNVSTVGVLSNSSNGILMNGQFNILTADVQLIYAALCTLVADSSTYFPAVVNGQAMTATQATEAAIQAAMQFGQNLILEFAAANVLAGITQAGQTQAVLDYTSNLTTCLTTGSLYAAIGDIEAMISDTSTTKANLSPFITNNILYNYLNQVQTYMGLPVTPNPGS